MARRDEAPGLSGEAMTLLALGALSAGALVSRHGGRAVRPWRPGMTPEEQRAWEQEAVSEERGLEEAYRRAEEQERHRRELYERKRMERLRQAGATKTVYRVIFDTASATQGDVDTYDTEADAEQAGEDWVDEMMALDPEAEEGDYGFWVEAEQVVKGEIPTIRGPRRHPELVKLQAEEAATGEEAAYGQFLRRLPR